MDYTISTHKGKTCYQKHSVRDEETIEKENEQRRRENERRRLVNIEREKENEKRKKRGEKPVRLLRLLPPIRIDTSKSPNNIYYVHEWIPEAYEKIFGEACREHDAKQKKNANKYGSYYEHIRKSKKMSPAYEYILTVGNDDSHPDVETCEKILHKFVESWNERNPSLYLCGAYFHQDEAGAPHVHLDFIPVVVNERVNGRGMKVETGLIRAIEQQASTRGIEYLKRDEEGELVLDENQNPVPMNREEILKTWTREQNDALDALVREAGFGTLHPTRDRHEKAKHRSIEEYEEIQNANADIDEEWDEIAQKEVELSSREKELDKREKDVKTRESKVERRENALNDKKVNQEKEIKRKGENLEKSLRDDFAHDVAVATRDQAKLFRDNVDYTDFLTSKGQRGEFLVWQSKRTDEDRSLWISIGPDYVRDAGSYRIDISTPPSQIAPRRFKTDDKKDGKDDPDKGGPALGD